MKKLKTILLTGSRAPGTLELARMLARFGHRVIAADSLWIDFCRFSSACQKFYLLPAPNSDAEGFHRRLLEIIQKEKVDILIPTCEEIFHVASIKESLSLHCEVYCESIAILKKLHHKGDFIAWAKSLGLAVPETHVLPGRQAMPTVSAARQLVKTSQGFVLKPSYTRFSNEVAIAADGQMPEMDLNAFARGRDLIVQAFIPGQQICTYSMVKNGKIIAYSSYRTRFSAGIGATIHFVDDGHPGCRVWVEAFVSQINFTGQIAFDFIEDQNGAVAPIECNPRLTSGIHLIGDIDLPALLDRPADASQPPVPSKGPSMISLAMLVYALPAARKKAHGLTSFVRSFRQARDLIYAPQDPWPFVAQFLIYLQFSLIALRHGIKPIEASTYDIQWEER